MTTRQSASTDFIPLPVALAHVAARESAPKLALIRALASKVRSRGFVRYSWPPYREGYEQLSPELFTNYPPQHGPARIDWVAATAVMEDGHPHPACHVDGIEVNTADLLSLWPGRLKRPARSRRTSTAQLVKASGRPMTSITTTADGSTTIHFGEPAPTEASNPWLADLNKVTKQ